MMIEERFPLMSDGELKSLSANVSRLATNGTDRQRTEADRLRPLVNSELQTRSQAILAARPARIARPARKSLTKPGK